MNIKTCKSSLFLIDKYTYHVIMLIENRNGSDVL